MPLEPSAQIDRLIKEAASKHGVEYALIKAHMKRESDFRIDVVREEPHIQDASIGPMQVLVKTAQWIMRDKTVDRKRLFDPAYNIDVGATYIAYNLKRYGGDLKKSIAAYNAGSARYKQNKQFINQPYVDFVFKWYQIYKEKETQEKIGIGVSIAMAGGIILLFTYFREMI